jgi:hypothetical protein
VRLQSDSGKVGFALYVLADQCCDGLYIAGIVMSRLSQAQHNTQQQRNQPAEVDPANVAAPIGNPRVEDPPGGPSNRSKRGITQSPIGGTFIDML